MAERSLRFDLVARDKSFSKTLDQMGRKGQALNRRLERTMGDTGDRAGQQFGVRLNKRLGTGLSASARVARVGAGAIGGALVAAGLAQFAKDSVSMAATFDKTMRQTAAVAKIPQRQMGELRKVALDMGAKTSFSARQAGEAMLELGKGGISFAQMKAGALSASLTLAAAGSIELGDAAGYVVTGLKTFGLRADRAVDVTTALAGAANASVANVEDMGLALAQTGAAANRAGLTVQETTAVLASFADQGVRGSDAGTSLKTMLARLVPQTEKASDAMEEAGLKFTDANGEFVSITNVAQQLQDRLGHLSDAEREKALATIFGSDATRAATFLMNAGEKGLRKYIKATSDRATAEKMARTNTEGAAGAFERLSGAVETIQIQIGDAFLPKLADAAEWLARTLPAALERLGNWLVRARGWWRENAYEIGLVVDAFRGYSPATKEAGAATDSFGASIDRIQSGLNRTLEVVARLSQGWNWLVIATYETAAAFADLIIGAGYAANAVDKLSGGSGRAADEIVNFGRQVKASAVDTLGEARTNIDRAQVAIDHLQANTRNAARAANEHAGALANEKNAVDALSGALRGEELAELDVRQAKINVQSAQKRLNDLKAAGRKGSLEYRQAQIDLRRAQIDLKGKTDEYKTAQQKANAATSGAMQASQRAKPPLDKLGESARTGGKKASDARIPWAKLGERVDRTYQEIKNKTATITAKFGWQGLEVFNVGGGLKAQAKGGPTSLGRVTLVGEEGPELVRFTSPGHVYTASETQAMLSRGMAGGGPVGRIPTFSMQGDRGFTDALGDWDLQVKKVLDLAVSRFKKLASAAGGGPGIQRALQWARTQEGKPYIWGGVGPAGYDCSGFLSALANVVMGRSPYRRLFATGSFPAAGWVPGFSPMGFSIGSYRGSPGHMAGTLGGVNVESRGSRGVVVGADARGAQSGLFGGKIWHLAGRSGEPGGQERWAGFDQGGWLPPGRTMAVNNTGRPERVLPPGDTGTVNLTVNVHNHAPIIGSPQAFAREATSEIRSELKRQLRREGKAALASQL
jgi:TP901 family phage tail tape measure protein